MIMRARAYPWNEDGLTGMCDDQQQLCFALAVWNRQAPMRDPGQPQPLPARWHKRNHEWLHFNSAELISMPNTWEYSWFAA
jgi:hypothetical protein